jgi:hypothetical protein
MRLGLHGQVRRRWAPRGIKLRQRVEVKYQWRYLALAVSATGALRWLDNMQQEAIAETVSGWKRAGIGALVWDSAPSHRARLVRQAGPPLVALPPYSPELNPAERIFEELRRAVEGRVWGTVEAKVAVVDALLQDLARSPERARRLAGWPWIRATLSQLPLQPSRPLCELSAYHLDLIALDIRSGMDVRSRSQAPVLLPSRCRLSTVQEVGHDRRFWYPLDQLPARWQLGRLGFLRADTHCTVRARHDRLAIRSSPVR